MGTEETIQTQIEELDMKLAEWSIIEKRIRDNIDKAAHIITLDVGGTIFKLSKDALLSAEGSYFQCMLGSGFWQPDGSSKAYFLDLDPKAFQYIVDYLRTGNWFLEGLTDRDKYYLLDSVEYLNIEKPPVLCLAMPIAESTAWRWDITNCSSGFQLSPDKLEAKAVLKGCWSVVKGDTAVTSFQVRIDSLSQDTCIGFVTMNPQSNKYLFRLSTGCLMLPNRPLKKGYGVPFEARDIFKATISNGTLFFSRNEIRFGEVCKITPRDSRFLTPYLKTFSNTMATIVE